MPLFEWSDDYSVGVAGMDRHHQKIFDMLNRLHAAMLQGKAVDMIGNIIRELLDYTKYHFGEEEKLMERDREYLYKQLQPEYLHQENSFCLR